MSQKKLPKSVDDSLETKKNAHVVRAGVGISESIYIDYNASDELFQSSGADYYVHTAIHIENCTFVEPATLYVYDQAVLSNCAINSGRVELTNGYLNGKTNIGYQASLIVSDVVFCVGQNRAGTGYISLNR